MSKTIGNMTLKATPVGNDAIAIADSEDSDKTKKVLLSSISGGGNTPNVITDTVSTTITLAPADNTIYIYTQPITSVMLNEPVEELLIGSEVQFRADSNSFTWDFDWTKYRYAYQVWSGDDTPIKNYYYKFKLRKFMDLTCIDGRLIEY